jgi:hypothetical protein
MKNGGLKTKKEEQRTKEEELKKKKEERRTKKEERRTKNDEGISETNTKHPSPTSFLLIHHTHF